MEGLQQQLDTQLEEKREALEREKKETVERIQRELEEERAEEEKRLRERKIRAMTELKRKVRKRGRRRCGSEYKYMCALTFYCSLFPTPPLLFFPSLPPSASRRGGR